MMGQKVWSQDISQAYIEGAGRISREVVVKPEAELQWNPFQLLQMLRPVYDLT